MSSRFAVILFASACAVRSIPVEDLDAALLDAKCERLARCSVFPTVDECRAFFRVKSDRDLTAAVVAGVVRYDGQLAQLCVDALASRSCDATIRETRVSPQACDGMFRGQRHAGDACEFDDECTSNACTPTAACVPGMCCPGTCEPIAPKAAVDEDCLVTADCATDTYCGTDHLCHDLEAARAECFVDAQCAYGLACDTTTFPGHCVVAAATGEACPDDRCTEVGARCVGGTCTLAQFGATCATAVDCTEFARCDVTSKTCTPYPATVGAACPDGFCAGEAWCESTTNECRVPLSNMEPCNASNQCATQFCAEGPAFDFCTTPMTCI